MSSADNSPGTYPGNLAAGKIDNNEMTATIRNDVGNACRRASSLIAKAGSAGSVKGSGERGNPTRAEQSGLSRPGSSTKAP
jgi:hypothetical protein